FRGDNMFEIKKGHDSVSKTFRLPVEMAETLEQLAQENKISLNQLVIQCLGYALDNLNKNEK
ncbi:MAG: toxin-antitoxin system HicB family antitoxin, partial [Clostridia bacterium]|nr:toxin-antitoxin system HicB family antitoxin [Clostridia bacterium]